MYRPLSVITFGVIVGRVIAVRPHPNAERIRLALVDLGSGEHVQIVFGGPPNVHAGSLVPVAPPGSRLPFRSKKMRRRRYRGEISHGMLCSLAELGWDLTAPDEVALLHNVTPGASLDDVTETAWPSLVINTVVINTASASVLGPVSDIQRLPVRAEESVTANGRHDEATPALSVPELIPQASTVAHAPATHTLAEPDQGAVTKHIISS